jgi:hypothetical protein
MKAFDVTGLINLDRVGELFNERREMLLDALNSNEPPEIPPTFSAFDYPCSYCKYSARCYSQGVTE